MTDKELGRFKDIIMNKRDALLRELGYLKETNMSSTPTEAAGEHSAYTHHMADVGTDNMEREKAFMYANRESRLLYYLDQALDRIQDKSYGVCRECEQPIDPRRLEAVPHATLCISCKSNRENGAYRPPRK